MFLAIEVKTLWTCLPSSLFKHFDKEVVLVITVGYQRIEFFSGIPGQLKYHPGGTPNPWTRLLVGKVSSNPSVVVGAPVKSQGSVTYFSREETEGRWTNPFKKNMLAVKLHLISLQKKSRVKNQQHVSKAPARPTYLEPFDTIYFWHGKPGKLPSKQGP